MGLWYAVISAFLVAILGMVQVRSKIFGGFPTGDWPKDRYARRFPPIISLCVLLWAAAAWQSERKGAIPLSESLKSLGGAVAPLLRLITALSSYGLKASQFDANTAAKSTRCVTAWCGPRS